MEGVCLFFIHHENLILQLQVNQVNLPFELFLGNLDRAHIQNNILLLIEVRLFLIR